MHIVSGKGKLYAEAAPCAPDEKIPDLKQAASPYGGWEYLGQAEEYTYKRSVPKAPSTILPLPISFIRKSEMTVGETFHTYFRQDGTFVIEQKPLVCEACGKKIDRYKDAGHETTVCRSCSRTMSVVRIARYVKQAVCEKQRIESQHPEIPVFPKEVVFNDRALLKLTKGKLYFGVLKEEYQGIMERLRARNSRFFVPPDQLDPGHPEIFPCCRLICCEGAPVGSYMENNRQIICNNLLVVYTKEKTWYYPVR